jgi:NAD+ kinase
MVYCKPFDPEVAVSFVKLYKFMQENFPNIQIFADKWLIEEIKENLQVLPKVFENKGEESRKEIDCIITLGGDGTILWASKQFRRQHFPPLISFAHGSLGYLCNFAFEEHQAVLNEVFSTEIVHLDERIRLSCEVIGQPIRKIFRGNNL